MCFVLSLRVAAIDDLKMSMPEAPVVVVKVAHPCYVSVLRAKLHRSLGIPLEHVRYKVGKFLGFLVESNARVRNYYGEEHVLVDADADANVCL